MDWTAAVLMQAADVVCSSSQTAAGSAATATSAKEAEGADSKLLNCPRIKSHQVYCFRPALCGQELSPWLAA